MREIKIENKIRYTITLAERQGVLARWFWQVYATDLTSGWCLADKMGYRTTRLGAVTAIRRNKKKVEKLAEKCR